MSTTRPRYLTKSRFKLALECITKLYYTGKKSEYADQNLDDPFLIALAQGGFQVGELAKYMFCEDPVSDGITVETLDYDLALAETNKRMAASEKIVIAEAAFKFQNLFIRADIVVKEGSRIDLYEVKAKSYNATDFTEDDFLSFKGKEKEGVKSDWIEYLYDVAFQKYVMTQALPGYEIQAHLLLTNKDAIASVDALNQLFKIVKDGNRTRILTEVGLKASRLGNIPLGKINIDVLIDKIWNHYPVPNRDGTGMKFVDFVKLCEEIYLKDERYFEKIGSKCKECQFYTTDENREGLKSGFMECWKNQTKYSDQLLSKPLVLELWGGRTDKFIENGIYLLEKLEEAELIPGKKQKDVEFKNGLTATERKIEQVRRVKEGVEKSYFDSKGLAGEMSSWKWPLHMIDFETSMVALPFYKGTKPYQGIAFQFSHHVMHQDGSVEHYDQFLHTEQGVYPNVTFVKALRNSLAGDEGSIFRYHNHENNYLRMIHRQLSEGVVDVNEKERAELMGFIDEITRWKNNEGSSFESGNRSMIDLYDLVIRYYYPPYSRGSNSLKQILPSLIRDSSYLREKYGKPGLYGKDKAIKSLNFNDHVWISEDKNLDPYKTLPPVFDGMDREILDNLVKDFDGLADGGAALTAYNYLQYSTVAQDQRNEIANALLRYCELDTLAMVMIVEGWGNWENK